MKNKAKEAPSSVVVLAVDPGCGHIGWCVLSITKCQKSGESIPTWIAHGTLPGRGKVSINAAELSKYVKQYGATLFAIENIAGQWISQLRAANLVQTAYQAGYFLGYLAKAFPKLQTAEIPATKWRKAITGNSHAKDAEIKFALDDIVILGAPKSSNPHNRDACGLALHAGDLYHYPPTPDPMAEPQLPGEP